MRFAVLFLALFSSTVQAEEPVATVPVEIASTEAADSAQPAPAEAPAAAPAPAEVPAESKAGDSGVEAVVEVPPGQEIPALVGAVQSQNWPLSLGILLTVLVTVANRFGLKNIVGPKAVPWVTVGLAVATSVGAALTQGIAVVPALVQGILAGVVAIGGWELVFKHFFSTPKS